MCEMPQVYGCDKPKARKEHRCYECRGAIAIGEVYHKHHGIWEGEASTFKVCADCEAMRFEVDNGTVNPDCITAFGELYESVFESDDAALIKRFMDIMRKRGAKIRPWMIEREKEAMEAI